MLKNVVFPVWAFSLTHPVLPSFPWPICSGPSLVASTKLFFATVCECLRLDDVQQLAFLLISNEEMVSSHFELTVTFVPLFVVRNLLKKMRVDCMWLPYIIRELPLLRSNLVWICKVQIVGVMLPVFGEQKGGRTRILSSLRYNGMK